MFSPETKIIPPHFQNQRYIGIFMSLRVRERGERVRAKLRKRERERKKSVGKYIYNKPGPK
jgi:hypothetical protein